MKEQILKGVIGLPISVFSYLLGGMDLLLQTLLLFILADYITGLLASGVEGKISSKIGYKGIIKKVGILIVVSICHLLDQVALNQIVEGFLPIEAPARTMAIIFYLGMEGISNLENLGRMGVPLPNWLTKAFDVLKNKGGK